MWKMLRILAVTAVVSLAGCQSSSPPPASAAQSSSAQAPAAQPPAAQSVPPSSGSGDAVTQKLRQLAGEGASDCGRVKYQPQGAPEATRNASNCAMQAAQGKRPFFVAYEMPGLTVAVAGNREGKLFSLQSEQSQAGTPAEVKSGPCTAELRVAESGRVTCMARGAMPGGSSPHGGMTMPPAQNPHGGMSMPPPGTPNPHSGGMQQLPRSGKSNTGATTTPQEGKQ